MNYYQYVNQLEEMKYDGYVSQNDVLPIRISGALKKEHYMSLLLRWMPLSVVEVDHEDGIDDNDNGNGSIAQHML